MTNNYTLLTLRDRSKIRIIYLGISYTLSIRSYTPCIMIVLYDFSFRYPELAFLLPRTVKKVTQAADIKTSFYSMTVKLQSQQERQ